MEGEVAEASAETPAQVEPLGRLSRYLLGFLALLTLACWLTGQLAETGRTRVQSNTLGLVSGLLVLLWSWRVRRRLAAWMMGTGQDVAFQRALEELRRLQEAGPRRHTLRTRTCHRWVLPRLRRASRRFLGLV